MLDNAALIAQGGVEIDLRGEKKVLYYTWSSVVKLARALREQGIAASFATAMNDFPIEAVPYFVWAGLQHYSDFDLTPEELGEALWATEGQPIENLMTYAQAAVIAVTRANKLAKGGDSNGRPLAKKKTRKSTGKK